MVCSLPNWLVSHPFFALTISKDPMVYALFKPVSNFLCLPIYLRNVCHLWTTSSAVMPPGKICLSPQINNWMSTLYTPIALSIFSNLELCFWIRSCHYFHLSPGNDLEECSKLDPVHKSWLMMLSTKSFAHISLFNFCFNSIMWAHVIPILWKRKQNK